MLDFSRVNRKEVTYVELIADLIHADLRTLTNEMVDAQLAMIQGCTDADVVFVPEDPDAQDDAAASADETNIAWTLGHIIVHITASSEESAFLAAELARGVPHHGRSRSEIPWQTVTTIAQCRHRLEESRRMRLATLDIWPDAPYMENTHQFSPTGSAFNAIGYFCFGLRHDDSHLAQIAEVVRQAQAARILN